jgi:hypothetical protein
MSGSRLADYLDQMLTAAIDARHFVDGMSKEDFLSDKRTQRAVVMSLVIIGRGRREDHGPICRIHYRPPRDSLARHERNAQSRRSWIFRREPRRRVGYHSDGFAGFVDTPGAASELNPSRIPRAKRVHAEPRHRLFGLWPRKLCPGRKTASDESENSDLERAPASSQSPP